MILRPAFYEVRPIDRSLERAAVGLRPDTPTALLLFGGEGSKAMVRIARDLGSSGLNVQLILMYGRNEELGRLLREMRLPIPAHVQGFTSEVPKFMRMADFMLGKPGPGSISEALAMQLPVIVDRNWWTLPQERYNAEWLLNHRLGMVVKNWGQVKGAVKEMLAPGRLKEYRERAAKVDNQAVFEIPEILERVMEMGE
jgi:1,2-diacylglycerol 3-beta-galactosyltransferase